MLDYNVTKIRDGVWCIDEFSMVYIYVVEGKDSAAVIDCGDGVWDLRRVVESLTDKPYRVLATHAHMDHVGGVGPFKRLYIHRNDVECFDFPEERNPISLFKRKQITERAVAAYGSELPFDPEHLVPVDRKSLELIPFEEGDVFSLGGRHLEVIHIPGHTMGSCVFLDREDRILFAGDNFGLALILPLGGSDQERAAFWLKGAEKLLEREDEFDLLCAGHYMRLDKSWMHDMINAARGIADGTLPTTICDADEMHGPMYKYGRCMITIDPANVRDRDFTRIPRLRRY